MSQPQTQKADLYFKMTKQCRVTMPSEVSAYLSLLKDKIKECVVKAGEKIKDSQIKRAKYEKLSLATIKDNGWAIVPEDKRPGYAIVLKSELKSYLILC